MLFGSKKNIETSSLLVGDEKNRFLLVLMDLERLLNNSGNNAQSEFIRKLIWLINPDNIREFIKAIPGVEMWGGSGSVWEVYVEDKDEERTFEKKILRLISLMDKTRIAGKGIMPIKRIFEDKLKKS